MTDPTSLLGLGEGDDVLVRSGMEAGGAMEIFGMKVVVRPDWPADRWALMPAPTNPIDAAACVVGATRSDIPGLWNAPGYPELTTGQLLSIASRMVTP